LLGICHKLGQPPVKDAARSRGQAAVRDSRQQWMCEPDAIALKHEHPVGNGGRHRLEQLELPALRDRAHELDHLAVVNGLLDPVGRRLGKLELEVVEERLLLLPLPVLDSVPPGDLESCELDENAHARAARAAASASTCSRTSWARRIVAPRS